MVKTILVLPDGTEISSGPGQRNAVQSCVYTQWVNSGTELTVGSVCAAMIELKLLTQGGLTLAAGDEVTVYEERQGQRQQLGIFLAEKPARPRAYTMTLTAYDRVSRLDKDLTEWLSALTGWPYALQDFAAMVCQACGLELTGELPNGSFLVQPFSAQGITGRQLMQWAGQIAGRFCRATAEGKLEFAWYEETDHTVGPSKTDDPTRHYCFQGGLTFEDYQVAPVEKVQLQGAAEDVGVIWPNQAEAANTYRITGNLLLTGADTAARQAVAQSLHGQLSAVTYTPCQLTIPANSHIRAGHILTVSDRAGRAFTAYIMGKVRRGQVDTLHCTGSPRRDSVSAVNEQSYQALSGKILQLRTDMDGIRAENKASDGRLAALSLTVDSVASQVQAQQADTGSLRTQVTSLEQTAQALQIRVQTIQDQGATKVKTDASYTFDDQGLRIAREGQPMVNLLDNTGMYVRRGEDIILQASSDGVTATDVRVRNYLCIGENSRLEDYEIGRTACFYTGG